MKYILTSILFLGVMLFAVGCSDSVLNENSAETLNSEFATEAEKRAPAPGGDTIADIVVASTEAEPAEFTLLLAAIQYIAATNPESALIAGLFDNDQYTVFAPNDAAFLGLVGAVAGLLDADVLAAEGPFAAIDNLLDAGTVEAVVSYHVVEGRRAANSVVPRVRDRNIQTLLGAPFSVTSGGQINAVGSVANIINPNISASNGIIHEIDAVLLPIDLGL